MPNSAGEYLKYMYLKYVFKIPKCILYLYLKYRNRKVFCILYEILFNKYFVFFVLYAKYKIYISTVL
jgi:hypothetical protein